MTKQLIIKQMPSLPGVSFATGARGNNKMNTIKDYKKAHSPFEMYLAGIHAEDYMGTDDEMSVKFETWITYLDHEELVEYANDFSKFLLDNIK